MVCIFHNPVDNPVGKNGVIHRRKKAVEKHPLFSPGFPQLLQSFPQVFHRLGGGAEGFKEEIEDG